MEVIQFSTFITSKHP